MGGIVSGLYEMGSAEGTKNAELQASERQWARERLAATVGIRQSQDEGAFQQTQIRAAGSGLAAEQAAAYSDSGVEAGVGTAAQVQANTQMKAELDAQQAKNNAAREVWGFKQQRKHSLEDYEARNVDANRKKDASLIGGLGKFGSGLLSMGALGG